MLKAHDKKTFFNSKSNPGALRINKNQDFSITFTFILIIKRYV